MSRENRGMTLKEAAVVGDRIRAIRRYNNLSIAELGKIIEIHEFDLNRVEKGLEVLSRAVIKLISYEFKVSVSWIMTGVFTDDDPKELLDYCENTPTSNFTYSAIQVEEMLEKADVDENHNSYSDETEAMKEDLFEFCNEEDKLDFDYRVDLYGGGCYFDGFLSGYRHAVAVIRGMLGLTDIPDAPEKGMI